MDTYVHSDFPSRWPSVWLCFTLTAEAILGDFFKGSLTLQGNILCLAFTETMNNTYREIRTDENRS